MFNTDKATFKIIVTNYVNRGVLFSQFDVITFAQGYFEEKGAMPLYVVEVARELFKEGLIRL